MIIIVYYIIIHSKRFIDIRYNWPFYVPVFIVVVVVVIFIDNDDDADGQRFSMSMINIVIIVSFVRMSFPFSNLNIIFFSEKFFLNIKRVQDL